ncbi:hypothetical protein AQUCO_02200226v1 [Aquilegia coerulea]|uniref:K Homology domain-containing protein n=1 Tax=Aquilegia coerulea TaxID=218851 RepID=A0A2G5DDT2_AQUCA|nr:hypothetical protein AQUCO_02200226v1 [Aquilegia coerulea]
MGETGKRSRSYRDYDDDSRSQKKKTSNKEDTRDDELIMYRILCPDSVIGSVIGRSGKVINSIRQETRAKIKVLDPFPGANERVITMYCYVKDKENIEVDDEFEHMDPLCASQDALLRVHAAIANAISSGGDSDKKRKDKEEAHILVPSSQAANIIGKSGATIKKMRSKTRANIKISPKDNNEPSHSCALSFDNFLLITGDAEAVKQALHAVSAIMYKFSPKEEIPLDTPISDAPPSIIIPSDMPIYPATGFYPSADSVLPSRSVSSILGASQRIPELQGYSDLGSTWPVYSPGLPLVSGYGGSSRSEELVIRLLCPHDQIGRVIGRGGSAIKSVRQESGARVEVDDTKGNGDDCLITVTATEALDDMKSMAVEAVLLLQSKINDYDDRETVSFRLLIPSKIIGCIIGRSGAIINEIRKRTKADVRISKSKKPKCAQNNDELVEVVGEVGSVRDALVQIVLRLRDDVLKDREGDRDPPSADSLYSGGGGSSLSLHSALHSVPPLAPLSYDQRVESGSLYSMFSSRNPYAYEPLPVGDNGYGSVSSYSSKPYAGLSSSTVEMLIPANAVGKVMGRGGGNIANIRKISGASIEIIDSKSSRGDRVAHISGTSEQKREAENLIQAFIMAT